MALAGSEFYSVSWLQASVASSEAERERLEEQLAAAQVPPELPFPQGPFSCTPIHMVMPKLTPVLSSCNSIIFFFTEKLCRARDSFVSGRERSLTTGGCRKSSGGCHSCGELGERAAAG